MDTNKLTLTRASLFRIVKGSRNMFAALLKKCVEKEVTPYCLYKRSDSSIPCFVALIPIGETFLKISANQTQYYSRCLSCFIFCLLFFSNISRLFKI